MAPLACSTEMILNGRSASRQSCSEGLHYLPAGQTASVSAAVPSLQGPPKLALYTPYSTASTGRM